MTQTQERALRERLRKRALSYLRRYATSRAHLQEVLENRLSREREPPERSLVRRLAADVVSDLMEQGLLDDRAFAEARAQRLLRQGCSQARIRADLARQGLERDLVDAAMHRISDEHEDSELVAAMALARRRRLGPWRALARRPRTREQELAALARAGFAYTTALRVVSADEPEAMRCLCTP